MGQFEQNLKPSNHLLRNIAERLVRWVLRLVPDVVGNVLDLTPLTQPGCNLITRMTWPVFLGKSPNLYICHNCICQRWKIPRYCPSIFCNNLLELKKKKQLQTNLEVVSCQSLFVGRILLYGNLFFLHCQRVFVGCSAICGWSEIPNFPRNISEGQLGDPFFTEPWLWEEGYVSWGMDIFNMISSLFVAHLVAQHRWSAITSEDIQRQKSVAHLIEIHTSDFSCDTLVNSRNGNLSGHKKTYSEKLIHWRLTHLCCVEWVPASLHSSMTLP